MKQKRISLAEPVEPVSVDGSAMRRIAETRESALAPQAVYKMLNRHREQGVHV